MVIKACRNCGKLIVQGPPSPDVYWYHPKGQTVYCDPEHTKRAEPRG